MDLDGIPFYKNRPEGLDAQTVESRSAVQNNITVLDTFFQPLPDERMLILNKFACATYVISELSLNQTSYNKRFKKFQRHLFRYAALV